MNIEYKRENHKSYLIIKNYESKEQLNTAEKTQNDYDMKMLCDNHIDGLLPVSVHTFNGEKELYYDISVRQPLSILYEKRDMGKEELKKLFEGIKKALENMEEYLLDMECLALEPEYIFIHSSEESIALLYCAYQKEDFEQKAYDFAEYILNRINHEDEQAVVYAYGFYRNIKEERGDLLRALERLLEEKEGGKEENGKKESDVNGQQEETMQFESIRENRDFYFDEEDSFEKPDTEKDVRKNNQIMRTVFFMILGLGGIGILIYSAWKYSLNWRNLLSEKESVVGAALFIASLAGLCIFYILDIIWQNQIKKEEVIEEKEETIVEEIPENDFDEEVRREQELEVDLKENSCETVLLQENCYHEQRILSGRVRGRKKQIDLSVFPFIIGKNKDQADYVLEDSSVSRMHARFTLRDDIVYLTDLNSTNGTCKNGIRLEPNELVMLEAEDEISFGRLTFTYH